MKKMIVIVAVSLLLLYVIGTLLWRPLLGRWKNDVLAEDMLLSLTYQKLPRTVIADRLSVVGLLVGNGNHCDFFSAVRFRSELSRAEVEEQLKAREVENWYNVVFAEDREEIKKLREEYDRVPGLEQITAPPPEEPGTVFIIYSFESRPYNGDLRCS